MSGKLSINEFVINVTKDRETFNSSDMEQIKEILRLAMSYYELRSKEVNELHEGNHSSVLYLDSIMEENILLKVVEIASHSDDQLSLEQIYESKVVRRH
ncbi:DUF6407 family protein [Evansella cellulosilytica]|uniref:Uncharacterized protein n=1 Tax=Evansella cellulosilytica (strain ATCC 21833 / DSM 2522 / FERM P-1141 / JCM 9156 / N-4) TaxID=649639 RepID=E6TXK2_EVAC2|nr:DUF6407 family protein [Evansella cellulosilytica]ADU28816.1 hypothetical protein Bcell_0534 [Evansella cellulosilytica DSM 2522]